MDALVMMSLKRIFFFFFFDKLNGKKHKCEMRSVDKQNE